MPNGTEKIIKDIKNLECGYCKNNLAHMYKGQKKKIVQFPAKVLLVQHNSRGNILIDTGYSKRVYENGIISKLYNLLNETIVTHDDLLISQLDKMGIKSSHINNIVLTHLHPDHIGGLKDFPNSKIIMSKSCELLLKKSSLKDLAFKNMLPKNRKENIQGFDLFNQSPLNDFFGIDLFSDNSIWLIDLPGHAKGQIGVYFPEHKLFFIADASWGVEYHHLEMKYLPTKIQHNYLEYKKTIEKINSLGNEIKIMSSHGNEDVLL